MITDELLKQAIKETAEGMLSGDPDYAAKCVTTRNGYQVRLFTHSLHRELVAAFHGSSGAYEVFYTRADGNIYSDGKDPLDLIPARRTFKCWVRWYRRSGKDADIHLAGSNDWPHGFDWLTDPVEVVAEEKEQP